MRCKVPGPFGMAPLLGLVSLLLVLAACRQGGNAAARPARWAKPITGLPGLENFYQVDDGLYRGAQPEEAGFAQLEAMGIKTVVNLRSLHSDRAECDKYGLDYVHITCQAWEAEKDEVEDFLAVATDPERRPVFVHCQHGADRTGMMVAVYRVVVMGWEKEEAIREMTEGGFGHHGIWSNLVTYVREFDPTALRMK